MVTVTSLVVVLGTVVRIIEELVETFISDAFDDCGRSGDNPVINHLMHT